MVPYGTNVVAIQKSFKQIVLDIHSLYTSHPTGVNVGYVDQGGVLEQVWEWGTGAQSEKTYGLFVPINRKWVGWASMRGEETIIVLDEVCWELLRTDFGQSRSI